MVLTPDEKLKIYLPYVEILQDVRKTEGISQSSLAAAVGLSAKYLTLVEGGKRVPSLECFVALMAEAGVMRQTAEQMVKEVLDQFQWKS